jgi:hypothetical protein
MRFSEDVGYIARIAAIPQTCYIFPECGSLKMRSFRYVEKLHLRGPNKIGKAFTTWVGL